MDHKTFRVSPGRKVRLANYDPAYTGHFRKKEDAQKKLADDILRLAYSQERLYASGTYGLLVIIQAMDAAGKDSVIKHVMTGVNPQSCHVTSFKAPSTEELAHDFLWRCHRGVPERGHVGIFNRSYYEETLIVRVHPEYLAKQHLPPEVMDKSIWDRRLNDINHFEHYLVNNGYGVVKFFLHVSKAEQKRRFLARLDIPEKNWKFSPDDVRERSFWNDYQRAYEQLLTASSTTWAPWYIIPADHKWFSRAAVADILVAHLKGLRLRFPVVNADQQRVLKKAKTLLERG